MDTIQWKTIMHTILFIVVHKVEKFIMLLKWLKDLTNMAT